MKLMDKYTRVSRVGILFFKGMTVVRRLVSRCQR